jgi:hypothetical protein
MTAVADYITMSADKPSIGAIRPRLNHVLNYAIATDQTGIRCDQIDEAWVARFRAWSLKQPILLPNGRQRMRSLSTVENSVLQLAAAINARGDGRAQFKAAQPKEVNRTPTYRADVPTIIRMFRYCLFPAGPTARSPEEIARRKHERRHLLAFLRISIATMARPDAAHDVSADPKRRQWQSNARVLDLNPSGRRQTRKFRATVPVAKQLAPHLDAAAGALIPTESVENAWKTMADRLALPGEGQSGMKLIRRSIAHIVRQRLPIEAHEEVTMFLGHDKFDDTSDLYAPFSPSYLRRALAVIEDVIDEIESGCPGAFYRAVTAHAGNVVSLGSVK